MSSFDKLSPAAMEALSGKQPEAEALLAKIAAEQAVTTPDQKEAIYDSTKTSRRKLTELGVPQEANDWIHSTAEGNNNDKIFNRWTEIFSQAPNSLDDLLKINHSLPETVTRLFDAKQKISSIELPYTYDSRKNKENTKAAMQPVLVPWQEFRRHILATDLIDFISDTARDNCGYKLEAEIPDITLSPFYDVSVHSDYELSRMRVYRNPTEPSKRLSLLEYLDQKISEDGPWGMILVQNNPAYAKMYKEDLNRREQKKLKDQPMNTPDILTSNGTDHYKVKGVNVGSMGIFEYMAYILQEADGNSHTFKIMSGAALLANRMIADETEKGEVIFRAKLDQAHVMNSRGNVSLGYQSADVELSEYQPIFTVV